MTRGEAVGRRAAARPAEHLDPVEAEALEQPGKPIRLRIDPRAGVERSSEVSGTARTDHLEAGANQEAPERNTLIGAAGAAMDDEHGVALALAYELDRDPA